MVTKVPSLSAAGWLTNINEKADALMSYYFGSEHSQTHLYRDRVTSLPYHIQHYGNNPLKLKGKVERDLTDYFLRYFEAADVTVTVDEPAEGDPERINLKIDATVMDDGKRYNLGKLIETHNSKIKNIFDINNTGSTQR